MNTEIYTRPFVELWTTVAVSLPRIVLAILVFVIGWMIAHLIYKGIVKLFKEAKVDQALEPTGLGKACEKAGYKLNVGKVAGFFLKWFVVIAFLVLSLDILGLETTKGLLVGILNYIPQVILAAFVLFIGFIAADFVKKLIVGSSKMVDFKNSGTVGSVAKVSILVFTVLIVLNMLGIGREIINILFIGVVAMISLAGGLAFGLGGRDAAAKAIEDAKHALHK
jgi:hypothetical protein